MLSILQSRILYTYLSQSTREEAEVLKKLAEKSMSMREKQYGNLVVQLEVEAHRNLD